MNFYFLNGEDTYRKIERFNKVKELKRHNISYKNNKHLSLFLLLFFLYLSIFI
jgi:hypothetical protein